MSLERIKAILIQEYFITIRSLEVILDLFYFSIITVTVFGLVTVFLSGSITSAAANYLILGMLLWEIIRIQQYSISVGALWNIWSRNLSNMFIAPLSLKEYLFAAMISGLIKTAVIFVMISLIASFIFKFNIFAIGTLNLVLIFINLTLFSWTIGLVLLGFIFRFGTRIQALAWGAIFIFQPLSAAFFPVNVLPEPFLTIARFLPATYAFEAARNALTNPAINWTFAGLAFVENIIYFTIALWSFNWMFTKSKHTGQFARNEG